MALTPGESIKCLRLAHLRQLAMYIHERDRDGWYYGPREQFEKRHKDLIKWVEAMEKYRQKRGVAVHNP